MAKAHRESRALCYGGFKQLVLTNKQCIWERETDGERVLVAVNIDEQPYHAHFDARCGRAVDLIPEKCTTSAAAVIASVLGLLLEVRAIKQTKKTLKLRFQGLFLSYLRFT